MMFFIINFKKLISLISIILIIFSATIFAVNAVKENNEKEITVIIDAGHGEPDGGCVGFLGSIEQKINLSVAKKVQEILEAKNINVIMTRTDSLGLWSEKSRTIREKKIEDMNNRLKIVKKSDSDLFVSIHMNSYPNKTAKGLRIFYDTNHPQIKTLCENIGDRICDVIETKQTTVMQSERNLFLLKNTPIPAILIECGFLSNPEEEMKLNSSDYQAKLAWAISDAIEKYYLLNKINQ